MIGTGFFSRPHQVPYPALGIRIFVILHEAVAKAFELLRKEHPHRIDLAIASENEVTCCLEHILECDLRKTGQIAGFNRDVFGKVTRGAEVTSFDNSHISKKPDLLVHLDRTLDDVWPTQDAIFIECKPVDKKHNISSRYCKDGVIRFVDGDYAWTMSEALMIGYVRDGFSILSHLDPVLKKEPLHTQMGSPTPVISVDKSSNNKNSENLYYSLHDRKFQWVNGQGPACQIQLFHSWHKLT